MNWLRRFILWLTPTELLLKEAYRRYGSSQNG